MPSPFQTPAKDPRTTPVNGTGVTPSSWVLADLFDVCSHSLDVPDHLLEDMPEVALCICPECKGDGEHEGIDGYTYSHEWGCQPKFVTFQCERCNGSGEVLDLPDPDPFRLELDCATCYGLQWLEERGSSPWYAKTRKHDPVLYGLRYEHLDVSLTPCPSCTPDRPAGVPVVRYVPYAEYMAKVAA